MKLESIVLFILSIPALLNSMIIDEYQKINISHSYEEVRSEKRSENILGYSFDTYHTILDIGNEDRKFSVCKDKQQNIIYFIANDQRIKGNPFGLFMIQINAHKIYQIHIFVGQDRRPVNLSRIWCSFMRLYGYDEETDIFLMKMQEVHEFKAYNLYDKLNSIYQDEFEKNNLALLTKSQHVNP
ncbi:hypothetical protein RF11_05390 [Thelohanellus kitauei]|uniref:Uncharacterized protein n=1 Tax=Thelohanellus kitauei TaxID=669202 RepID=A0A0C2MKT3_THEKT|nr:hypothetical protein RF11_05390 [Thelohanellus kitauei]